MSKRLIIELQELVEFDSAGGESWVYDSNTRLYDHECLHICKHHTITNDELTDAIDTIISGFVQSHNNKIIVNIAERNRELAPAKEMTVEEIEAALGFKIKIVKEKE